MITMKKIFWIRTGLLLIILIFAIIGGRFLYTGAESFSPLDMASDSIPLTEDTVLVQTFTPGYARITSFSLALQPHDSSAAMSAASGELTVILSDHATGQEIYSNTVSLEGVPDHWYLNFPVNCRLDTNTQYDLSIRAQNYQEEENPSLYLVTQAGRIPEITEDLAQVSENMTTASAFSVSLPEEAFAAMGLSYEILVSSRLAVFLVSITIILLCMAVTAVLSRKEAEKRTKDITLGKFLAIRIHRIPLIDISFFAAITIAAVIIRIAFLSVKSNDYYIAYEVWINEIRGNGGLASLGKDIGDNPPLYMTLVTLASCLPFEPVVIVKLPSILFDFILAAVCIGLSGQLGVTDIHRKLTLYAVILLNPLTLLDSAAWGQCDSLYSSFILLTLLAACSARLWSAETPKAGKNTFWRSGDGICLMFAVAASFKLQSIFFLPILCLLWITQKRNVLKPAQLLWVPMVYTISCIPMYLAGRSLKVMFKIYLGQANRNYGTLTLNYPNLYSLIGTWSESLYDSYFTYGMLLTFLMLILLFYQLYSHRVKLSSLTLCKVTALSILTVCFFMPLIHERYAYVAEMLLFVIMIKDTKYIRPALITMLCTLFTYCTYLMQLEQSFTVLPDWTIALVRLGVIYYLAWDIFHQQKQALKNGQ